MPLWQWLVDAVGIAVALSVLWGIAVVVRRRWIARSGGTFEFSIRVQTKKAGRGWVLGVGRYSGEVLEWFRVFSLGRRPKRCYQRSELAYVGRRDPVGAEAYSLYSGHVVVSCATPDGILDGAMSPDSLTGFLAWLEAGPPGLNLPA